MIRGAADTGCAAFVDQRLDEVEVLTHVGCKLGQHDVHGRVRVNLHEGFDLQADILDLLRGLKAVALAKPPPLIPRGPQSPRLQLR